MSRNTLTSPWLNITRIFAVNALFAAGLFAHGFLYNFYLTELGLRERVLGNAAAALTLGGLLALLPAGVLIDRIGPRRAYAVAALLLAVGLGAGGIVTAPIPIYAAAVLAGAGTAMWRVAMGPLLMSATTEASRARAFSWNVAVLLGSGALWTALAGAAPAWLAAQFNLSTLDATRAALILGAAGSLLGLGVVAGAGIAVPNDEHATARMSGSNLRADVMVPGRFILLAGLIAFWMIAGGLVIPFLNLFFHQVHNLPVERVGVLFAIAQLVGAAMVFLGGELSSRLGASRMLLFWTLLYGPLLWLLGTTTTLSIAMVLFVAQSIIAPATNALIDQLLMERAPPERRGAVSSWRNAATETSGFAGSSAGGRLLEQGGFGLLSGIAGGVAAAGAVLLNLAFRATREPDHQPTRPAAIRKIRST